MCTPLKNKLMKNIDYGPAYKQEDVQSAVKWLKREINKDLDPKDSHGNITAGILCRLIDEAFEDAK